MPIQRVVRGAAAVGKYEIGVGGDFIVAIDGKAVDRQDALSQALARKHAGDNMDLTVYRGGKQMSIKVKLGEAPEERFWGATPHAYDLTFFLAGG